MFTPGDIAIPPGSDQRKHPVEVRGFEPLTSAVRRQRSTGLSYTPSTAGQGNKALRGGRDSARPGAD